MSEQFIRVYQNRNIKDIEEHLLAYGDTSGSCAKCNALDLKLALTKCPKCGTYFKFVSFRNIKVHLPKVQKLKSDRPDVEIVDFDDFKRMSGERKAREFLK